MSSESSRRPGQDSAATSRRRDIDSLLGDLLEDAGRRSDPLALVALTALRRVHGLYPDAEQPCRRGTPENRAHTDIHNAVVEVFAAAASITGLAPTTSASADT